MKRLANEKDGEYKGKHDKKEEKIAFIFYLILSAIFLLISFSSWNDFVALEEGKMDLEVDHFTYAMYKVGGKVLVNNFFMFFVVLFALLGLRRLYRYKNAE
jgi:type III secretory pathway component EscU